jgi:hypothetical protein
VSLPAAVLFCIGKCMLNVSDPWIWLYWLSKGFGKFWKSFGNSHRGSCTNPVLININKSSAYIRTTWVCFKLSYSFDYHIFEYKITT